MCENWWCLEGLRKKKKVLSQANPSPVCGTPNTTKSLINSISYSERIVSRWGFIRRLQWRRQIEENTKKELHQGIQCQARHSNPRYLERKAGRLTSRQARRMKILQVFKQRLAIFIYFHVSHGLTSIRMFLLWRGTWITDHLWLSTINFDEFWSALSRCFLRDIQYLAQDRIQ
jgi:hypothetical protein